MLAYAGLGLSPNPEDTSRETLVALLACFSDAKSMPVAIMHAVEQAPKTRAMEMRRAKQEMEA